MNELLVSIEQPINKLLSSKYGTLKASILLIGLSIGLHFVLYPALGLHYTTFLKAIKQSSTSGEIQEIILEQSESITKPFEGANFTSENHRFKMMYRLFLPMTIRFLSIENVALFIFISQFVLLFAFIPLLLKWLTTKLEDSTSAFYLTFLLSGTYAISAFWMDTSGYGDAFAYFFLFVTLSSKLPALVFIAAFCTAWIDERAFVCLGVILFWKVCYQYISEKGKLQLKITKDALAVLVVLVLYTAIRIYLGNTLFKPYATSTDFIGEYLSVAYENIKNGGFSIWRGYKGLFSVALLLMLILITKKQFSVLMVYVLPFYICILFAFGAYDLSRSLNFFYPFILFSTITLRSHLTKSELRIFLLCLILITIYCSNLSAFRLTGGFTLM